MLLHGKLSVCPSLCPDYAINIMHEHVNRHPIILPCLSLRSSRFCLVFRDTAVTSDGNSINLAVLCYPV